MVTKPTGRPRGRPRKQIEKTLIRSRGRPRKGFLDDPDRYIIALMDACELALKKTKREAALIAVAESVGNMVLASDYDGLVAPVVAKALPGEITIAWAERSRAARDDGAIDTREGSRWSNVESRATVIRTKARKWDDDGDASKWRSHMSAAFAVALGHPFGPISFDNIRAAKHSARWEANEVGEQQIAEKVIVPMIDRAMNILSKPAPDFSLIFRSKT